MMQSQQAKDLVRARLIAENELPPIPDGWGVERLRFLLTESKERNGAAPVGQMLAVSEYRGVVPKDYEYDEHRRTDAELENYRVVRPGQLAVNSMWLNHLGLGVSEHLGHVSPAYGVYDVSPRLDTRFLHHLVRSNFYLKIYLRYLYGIRPNSFQIKSYDWASIPIIVPDLPTQKRIAAFLDRETARIDELIAKKERLVGLLRERGNAAREELLWGEGPISKLGYHISILPGYAFASASFSDNPEDIRLLRGANVGVNEVRWDDTVYWPTADAKGVERFRLEAGDLVMGMDRPWISGGIRVAEIQESDLPCLLLQRVCKISPRKTLEARYLKAMIESKRFVAYFEPILTGVSVPHISGDQIANFRFPFIGVDEQVRRMDDLEKITRSIQPIARATQTSIDRLREYRAALITAAVTGQIDVGTYGIKGTTSATLDRIEEEMQA